VVAVAGDHLHAGHPAGGQAAQERQPSRAVPGGGHVQAEDLPLAVGVDAGGDQGVPLTVRPPSRTFWVIASPQPGGSAGRLLRFQNSVAVDMDRAV